MDVLNPVMGIDILVEKLESEMSGPNMWHFVYVLKSILFDRGEKAEEILLTEVNYLACFEITTFIETKDGRDEDNEIGHH